MNRPFNQKKAKRDAPPWLQPKGPSFANSRPINTQHWEPPKRHPVVQRSGLAITTSQPPHLKYRSPNQAHCDEQPWQRHQGAQALTLCADGPRDKSAWGAFVPAAPTAWTRSYPTCLWSPDRQNETPQMDGRVPATLDLSSPGGQAAIRSGMARLSPLLGMNRRRRRLVASRVGTAAASNSGKNPKGEKREMR